MKHIFDRVKLPFQKNSQLRRALFNILGYYPHNLDLYREALAHKSRQYRGRNGQEKPVNNERLEFLGDAILEATVSDVVYRHFPGKREGFLTNTRSKLVQRDTLNKLAVRMGIIDLIHANTRTQAHNSYMGGNAFEALVGALYLDRGYKAVQDFVERRMMDSQTLDIDDTARKETNFKSKLLEWAQKNKLNIEFRIDKEDTDGTSPVFETSVIIEGVVAGTGKGFSKKKAEQETARQALSRLRHEQGFKDRVFGGKEKRTAMEAEEFAALPRIDDIEMAPNAGDVPATGEKKPARHRKPRRRPAAQPKEAEENTNSKSNEPMTPQTTEPTEKKKRATRRHRPAKRAPGGTPTTIVVILLWLMMAAGASAQVVDKDKVQTQAKAAEGAQADLKKADTGEKDWKFSGVTGVNAAATGLVNWSAGGNNNVNGVAFGRLRLLYHKNRIAWDTNLDLEYGMTYIDQEYDKVQKSSDKINISTKFGYEFAKHWYATALAGFNTQFDLGREYNGLGRENPLISKFMAPAYTDVSVGIDWKPNNIFSVYVSPVAGRFTTVAVSDAMNRKYDYLYPVEGGGLEQFLKDKYGVWHFNDDNDRDYRRNTRAELGFSLKGSVNYQYKDLKVMSTLGLYTPYAWDKTKVYKDGEYLGYRDNNRRLGNFDVDWDVALSYQFLKCLQVTVSTSMKYYNGVKIADKDGNNPVERVQFKSVLGVGVGYSF